MLCTPSPGVQFYGVGPIYTVSPTRKLEYVQRRAERYTLGRYRLTSSVDATLTQLEWEPLAARRRTARLVLFYKIHNGLVAIPMPLLLKLHPLPTRTENSQAYHISISSRDYHLHSFYTHKQCAIGIFFLRLLSWQLLL